MILEIIKGMKKESVITILIFSSLSISVTVHNLLVRFSRNQPGPIYSTTIAVVFTELLKLIVSIVILLYTNRWSVGVVGRTIYNETVYQPRFLIQTCIPSFIYAIQNNLVPVALTNLDTSTFQVTLQLKIFWTTLFARLLLQKTFSTQRYFALLLLFIGEILVHWDLSMSADRQNVYQKTSNYTLGFSAALLTCLGSGFSGVYLEMVIRKSHQSQFWIRNFQMYMCGVLINSILVIWSHFVMSSGESRSIFQGFNWLTVNIIVLNAAIGMFTAFIIKRLDNIWKNLASSASVAMSTLGSAIFLGTPMSGPCCAGILTVILVPYIYYKG